MDWGLILTLKGGWRKRGNESMQSGFLGHWVEFWDNFFFSNHESRCEDRNGGLGSSFQQTGGDNREESRFWP